jgi:predicted nuclease of restriction endonuclease-like RecB superfamily
VNSADISNVQLYGELDLRWIDQILDLAVALTGQPWRTLRERLEHTAIMPARAAAIVKAMRLATGGGAAERARIAKQVRRLVLGPPALDDAARGARIAAAAEQLGLDERAVEELMWIDLVNERPVAFPRGRPRAIELAAQANLDKLQGIVRRAKRIRLRVWDDAHELIRMARRHGLVTTVTRDSTATVLDIVGPLGLFHDTSVYGRSLGALVPLLADHRRFELDASCDLGYGPTHKHLSPPVLLPPLNPDRLARSQAARVARQLDRVDIEVERDPPALAHGAQLLHPELAVRLGGRRWLVELLGFATAEHLAATLAAYEAAGVHNVALCVPAKRAPAQPDDPRVIRHAGRIDAAALVAALGDPR